MPSQAILTPARRQGSNKQVHRHRKMSLWGRWKQDPRWSGACLVLALSLIVGLQTFSFYFVMDDNSQILGSTAVQQQQWGKIWTNGTWQLVGGQYSNYFRPFQVSLWAIEYKLFGKNPAGYHVIEVILYAAAGIAWLLWWLRLGVQPVIAIGAAALWVLHPANATTLSWISCSADSLAVIFGVAALWCWTILPQPLWSGGAVFWMAALLSKEWALVLPIVAFAVLLARQKTTIRELQLVRRFWATVPIFMAWLLYRRLALGSYLYPMAMESLSGKWKYIVAGFYREYLAILVLLKRPPLWDTFWPSKYVSLTGLTIGVIAVAAMLGWAVWLWVRGRRLAAVFAGLALMSLVPTVFVNKIPWPVIFNPRYLFFVTPFYAVALCTTCYVLFAKRMATCIIVVLCLIFAAVQFGEVSPWKSQLSFFEEASRRSPDSPLALYERAKARSRYVRSGHPEEFREVLGELQHIAAETQDLRRADVAWIHWAASADQSELTAYVVTEILKRSGQVRWKPLTEPPGTPP